MEELQSESKLRGKLRAKWLEEKTNSWSLWFRATIDMKQGIQVELGVF